MELNPLTRKLLIILHFFSVLIMTKRLFHYAI